MDCSNYSRMIVPKLQGRLEDASARSLDTHIKTCKNCRKEYQETEFLFSGMKQCGRDIASGHISPRLLWEYARAPESLEKATADSIRIHLENCHGCREDLDRITFLISIHISEEMENSGIREPYKRLLPRILSRRMVAAYAALAFVAVIAAALIVLRDVSERGPYLVRTISGDFAARTEYEIHDLPVSRAVRGESEKSSDLPRFSLSGVDKMVFRLQVEAFSDAGQSYRVYIRTENGDSVWDRHITPDVLTGGLLLLVEKKSFKPGVYDIEIVEYSTGVAGSIVTRTEFLFTD